jgi:hypothetical protein
MFWIEAIINRIFPPPPLAPHPDELSRQRYLKKIERKKVINNILEELDKKQKENKNVNV